MKILILFISLLYFNTIAGQCQCQTKIVNGVEMKICTPSMVANDNNYQAALSVVEIANETFLVVTIRFIGKGKTIGSDLFVNTDGEQTLNLKLEDSQKDYISGSEICHSKFKITREDIRTLKSNNLKGLRFHFSDEDLYRTFEVKMNKDIVGKYLKCLNK